MKKFIETIWTILVISFIIWVIYNNFFKSTNTNTNSKSYPLLEECRKNMQNIINDYNNCKLNLEDKKITYKWDYILNDKESITDEALLLLINCENKNNQIERFPFYQNPRYLSIPASVLDKCEFVIKYDQKSIEQELNWVLKVIAEIVVWKDKQIKYEDYSFIANQVVEISKNSFIWINENSWAAVIMERYISMNNKLYDFIIEINKIIKFYNK